LSGKNIEYYANLFSNLNRSGNRAKWPERTLHKAPQKPSLLLSVLDLVELGEFPSNLIRPSDELIEIYERYWERSVPFTKPSTLAMPFVRLKSEGFWHLSLVSGREQEAGYAENSLSRLRECVRGAVLDEKLYELVQNEENREYVRSILVESCFAPYVRQDIRRQSLINREAFLYSEELLKHPKDPEVRESLAVEDEYLPTVRDQGFRRAVIKAYAHRCTMCGIRVRTPEGHTLAEAAHIRVWSESNDDRPVNGFALCRTCHWTFDSGLLSVSQSYEVITSDRLTFYDNMPGYLTTLEGRSIILPTRNIYYPDHDCLDWHRRNVLRRG
jgi:putative restriction endonuclease